MWGGGAFDNSTDNGAQVRGSQQLRNTNPRNKSVWWTLVLQTVSRLVLLLLYIWWYIIFGDKSWTRKKWHSLSRLQLSVKHSSLNTLYISYTNRTKIMTRTIPEMAAYIYCCPVNNKIRINDTY